MRIEDFNVNLYTENRLRSQGIYNEENRESFRKQVINLLKYFTYNININFFDSHKGKHIFNCFPLEFLSTEDCIIFLNHIFDLKEQAQSKIVANINKINIDNDYENEDNKSKYRDYEYFYINKEEKSELDIYIYEAKLENRALIRDGFYNAQDVACNLNYVLHLLDSENLYCDIAMAADYAEDTLLQILNYWVITIGGIETSDRLNIVRNIENYLDGFEKDLFNNFILKKEDKRVLNLDEAVGIYTAFLTKRNSFGQCVAIVKALENEEREEPELFRNPDLKFKVNKNRKAEDFEETKSIITEGINVNAYEEKLDRTKEMIKMFSEFGGRNASTDSILDLKVYFREFYISNIKYKRKAQTIIRKYIERYREDGSIDNFEKASEYNFIREKVSRGYYRETIGLELYNEKNRLQVKLDELILRIFLTYDYKVIFELMRKLSLDYIQLVYENLAIIAEKKF